jgi:hypothetical protein
MPSQRPSSVRLTSLLAAVLFCVAARAHAQAVRAEALFGAYGGAGFVPTDPPADFVSWFAVIVVEIDSSAKSANVAVSDFRLIDQGGRTVKYARLISAEEFDRVRVATESECAYWTNSGGTRPWDGTLPQGKIRLRVRVALGDKPPQWDRGVAFELTIGRNLVAGRITCVLPS